jgi:TorA maturation chaperone TorD
MSVDTDELQARAEFYLCLARAFLSPTAEDAWMGLRDALADDLEDLAGILGHDIGSHIADYRASINAIPDHATLLQIYSGLFLAPPRPVNINTGVYLDGALNGGSVLAMEESYRQNGLVRSNEFLDLSDHLSIQLEFVASRLLARQDSANAAEDDAERFLATFVARWLPPFIADLEVAGRNPNPWLHLARAMSVAVLREARAESVAPGLLRQQNAIGKARHERAVAGVSEEDMAFITQRLQERGLATDHLAIPHDQRDEARGLSRKAPLSPRRGSRLG